MRRGTPPQLSNEKLMRYLVTLKNGCERKFEMQYSYSRELLLSWRCCQRVSVSYLYFCLLELGASYVGGRPLSKKQQTWKRWTKVIVVEEALFKKAQIWGSHPHFFCACCLVWAAKIGNISNFLTIAKGQGGKKQILVKLIHPVVT